MVLLNNMREEVKRWWDQANEDLATAKDNININRFSYAIFLCEQAVEKALKSLYLAKFKKVPRVHDLTIFAKKLELPQDLYDGCEDLTNVYTETRYPDMSEVIPSKRFTGKEAEEFLEKAEEIITWVKKKL